MKKFVIILALGAALLMTGCNKWLDINKNPNYVDDAEMSMLLPTVQLMTADKVGYELSLYGSFWAQYVVQNSTANQYYTVMTNDVTNSSFTSPWSYFYASVLPRCKEIITKAEEAGNAKNYVLEAKAMLTYSLYLLTSLYDQVAYTEGYLTESQTPHFDTGEHMQEVIIGLCEEIRNMNAADVAADEENITGYPTAGSDMIFGGDTDAWFQFVNTLYLKVLLRDFNANKAKITSLLAENNFLEKNAAFANFADQTDKSNPFYESDRRQLNTQLNIRCCSDILKVLDVEDARLYSASGTYGFYDSHPKVEGSTKDVVAGGPYGVSADPDESSRLALYADEPVYFSTVDEAEFLKAEAYARLGNAEKAQEAYEAALIAAFARIKVKGAEDFISGAYAFQAGSSEEMLKQIITQKWASNVHGLPWESWFDINRTGYPVRGEVLTDAHGVLDSGYPMRFIYSKTSADYNPNSPTPVDVNVKMWWHK